MAVRNVRESATGTTDANGAVTLRIEGPHRTGSEWVCRALVLQSVKAAAGYPQAAVYRTDVAPYALLGESRAADKVTFDSDDVLVPGDTLVIVITGAEPNTSAVANLTAVEYAAT